MQTMPSGSEQVSLRGEGGPVLAGMTMFPGGAGVGPEMRTRRVGEGAALVHDAGNLLGALRMYSDLLGMPGVLMDQHTHLAKELQALSERSSAMIERLVEMGVTKGEPAVEERRLPEVARRLPEVEATVLPDAVLGCLGLLSKIAGRAVTFFCAPSAYFPVLVSRAGLERIVVNLVKNAAESGARGETVAVTLMGMREQGRRDGGSQVVLTVRDKGRGMSAAELQQLTGERRAGGDARRGLGFQVVRDLAEESGGVVEVESEPGQGTSVSVSWPTLDPLRARRDQAGVSAGGLGSKAQATAAELLLRGER